MKASIFGNFNKSEFLWKNLAIGLILFLLWFTIFYGSGIFSSGLNFIVDDHDIVAINYDLSEDKLGLISTLFKWLIRDFHNRFRPLYYTYKVLLTSVYGVNHFLWYFHYMIVATVTSFFLFLFARLIKLTIIESFLFSLLILIGDQSISYWRLGTPESLSMLLTSLALVLSVLSSKKANDNLYKLPILECFFILSVTVASLSKESCILMIPAFALIKVWTYSSLQSISYREAAYKNKWTIMLLISICFALISVIVLFIGMSGTGYAGLDSDSFSLQKLLAACQTIFVKGNVIVFFVLVLFLVSICFHQKCYQSLISILPIILIGIMIVLPQIIIYSKSGIHGYYLLPALIGCSFVVIILLNKLRENNFVYLATTSILCLILLTNIMETWQGFHGIVTNNKNLFVVLNQVELCATPDDPILVVANPRVNFEALYGFKIYFEKVLKRDNLLISTYGAEGTLFNSISLQEEELFWKFLDPEFPTREWYNNKTITQFQDKGAIKTILVMSYDKIGKDFLNTSKSWFSEDLFTSKEVQLNYPGQIISVFCKL